MRKPRLIPNWRRAWRMFSMQAMGWGAAMLTGWPLIPDDLRATVDPALYMRIAAALLVAGMFGRLIHQPKADSAPPAPPAQP
jgi:hypothetical protein